ncbi:MAG: ORF6N domain-containing protein [bacterium]|nr:ORF6N domain-containing protein [bacterium]
MATKTKLSIVSVPMIERRILLIRGQKVLLDSDLADLYGVETKVLNRAVNRNIDRFPKDFMFQLNKTESASLRFQIGTSNSTRGGRRYNPYVFTEQGVAMLSSVLNSKRAIAVNIEIMRAFVKLRELMATHADLARKLKELEKKYDKQFAVVFDAIRALMNPPNPPESKRKKIGFRTK